LWTFVDSSFGVRFVMMTSRSVERQKRYIARIAADPQKRAEFLMKDRQRKKEASDDGAKRNETSSDITT